MVGCIGGDDTVDPPGRSIEVLILWKLRMPWAMTVNVLPYTSNFFAIPDLYFY